VLSLVNPLGGLIGTFFAKYMVKTIISRVVNID
jgi:hypothetical protein